MNDGYIDGTVMCHPYGVSEEPCRIGDVARFHLTANSSTGGRMQFAGTIHARNGISLAFFSNAGSTSVYDLGSSKILTSNITQGGSGRDFIEIIHDGELEITGDISLQDERIALTLGENFKGICSGTANQTISLPESFAGTEWVVDKPAGKLDLSQFDGLLQGRVTNVFIGPNASVDLAGVPPLLLNSRNELVEYHGLKADAVSETDFEFDARGNALGLHRSPAVAAKIHNAMKCCENSGTLVIPQAKGLWAKTFKNNARAAIEGAGLLEIRYDGMNNVGYVATDTSLRFFDLPVLAVIASPPPPPSQPEDGPTKRLIHFVDQPITVSLAGSIGTFHRLDWADGDFSETTALDTFSHTYSEDDYHAPYKIRYPLLDLDGVEHDITIYTIFLETYNEEGSLYRASRNIYLAPAVTMPPPQAWLSITPSQGAAPVSVTASTAGAVGMAMIIDWGDGTNTGLIEMTERLEHVYEEAGRILVVLKVRNAAGVWSQTSQTITVLAADQLHAELTVSPSRGYAPLTVLADASHSHGQSLVFDWGDGTATGPQAGNRGTHTNTGMFTQTAGDVRLQTRIISHRGAVLGV